MTVRRNLLGLVLGILGFLGLSVMLSSCSTTMSAIEHRHLQATARMSNTVFLTPVSPSERTVFVEIRNTSDVPMPDLQADVVALLQAKGYKVVQNPNKAHYWLQANVLYMGKESKSITASGALAGGYGGALVGSAFGSGTGKLGAMGAGAVGGAVLGAIVGSEIHVDKYMGVVDVQVKERVKGTVNSETTSNLQQGIGTTYNSTYSAKSHYQAYRTRIVVTATQTNMNLQKAVPIIESKIAREIAGMF